MKATLEVVLIKANPVSVAIKPSQLELTYQSGTKGPTVTKSGYKVVEGSMAAVSVSLVFKDHLKMNSSFLSIL